MTQYDLTEATNLVADAIAKSTSRLLIEHVKEQRSKAQGDLLDALLNLNDCCSGLFFVKVVDVKDPRRHDPRKVVLGFGDAISVEFDFDLASGDPVVRFVHGDRALVDREVVPLEFDLGARVFHGRSLDGSQRSAVAVVVEAVLKLIAKHTPA